MSKAFTPERLSLEKEAKIRIIENLEKYGYKVLEVLPIPEDVSLTTITDLKVKQALSKLLHTKFDLIIGKGSEFYLVECKGKSKDAFKVMVNKSDYDAYYEIAKVTDNPHLIYLIWVKENKKIYRHEITNPTKFKIKPDKYEKDMYLIPDSLIHEIEPDWVKSISMWFRLDRKTIEYIFNR